MSGALCEHAADRAARLAAEHLMLAGRAVPRGHVALLSALEALARDLNRASTEDADFSAGARRAVAMLRATQAPGA